MSDSGDERSLGAEGEVKWTLDEGVLLLTIDRPRVLNALSRQTLDVLEQAFEDAAADDTVKAVVITGGGEKAFVAGADIPEIKALDTAEGLAFAQRGHALFRRIAEFPRVVIAAVNGFALGGGCELAMACDIRLADEKARFGQPEINLGILPGYGGTQRLPRLVGRGRALQILLTGDMLDAARAAELGLVDRVVPAGTVVEEAVALARTIAGKAPLAVAAIKKAVAASEGDPDAGFVAEAQAFAAVMVTDDKVEGIDAFLEKRAARWTGA